MKDEKYIYFTKEVAKMFGLTVLEARGVAKIFGIKREFGAWKFTYKDIERIKAVKTTYEAKNTL